MIDLKALNYFISNWRNQSFGHLQKRSNLRIIDERYKVLLHNYLGY